LPRIQRARVDLAACGFNVLDQWRELVAVAAAGKDREPFGGKFLGDFAADIVAGADDSYGLVSLLQGSSPALGVNANVARVSGAAIRPTCVSIACPSKWRGVRPS